MGLSSRLAATALGLAIVLGWLTDRHRLIWLTVQNHPSRLPQLSAFADHQVILADQLRNCEDVHLDEQRGFALLSCDPGRDTWNTVMGTFINASNPGTLYLYDYASAQNNPTAPHKHLHALTLTNFPTTKRKTFHPLGLAYNKETSTLFVANHAPPGPSIELFTLNPTQHTLTHKQSITHPLLHGPNALLALSPQELYITNDHRWPSAKYPVLNALETYTAYAGGTVVHANLATGEYKVVARLPFANGIAALNASHLAVASTTSPSVTIYLVTEGRGLERRLSIRTRFLVDNLSVDAKGRLVMAGHPFFPALGELARRNYRFEGLGDGEGGRPRAPSWVAEWDGNVDGVVRDLFVDRGGVYGCSSGAVRDVSRGVGLVVGLYERGILVWRE